MSKIGKAFALILTVIVAMSCLTLQTVKPASAQSPLGLPIPGFIVYFVGKTYNIPATASVDQYTGENVTIPSHFVTNGTIYLVVKNNPQYIIKNNPELATQDWSSTYDFRMKGHFADNWTAAGEGFSYDLPYTVYGYSAGSYPPNAQIDFQVKVSIYNNTSVPYNPNYINSNYYEISTLYATSGWSGRQTVTIANSTALAPQGYGGPAGYYGPSDFSTGTTTSPTTSPTATSTAAVPELSWIAIAPLFLSVFSVAMVLRHRKVSRCEA